MINLQVDQSPVSKAYKLLAQDDISGQYINLRSAHEPSCLLAIQDQLINWDRMINKLVGNITLTSLFRNLAYIDRWSRSIPLPLRLVISSSALYGSTLYTDVRIIDLVEVYDLAKPITIKPDSIIYSIRRHVNRPTEICAEIII